MAFLQSFLSLFMAFFCERTKLCEGSYRYSKKRKAGCAKGAIVVVMLGYIVLRGGNFANMLLVFAKEKTLPLAAVLPKAQQSGAFNCTCPYSAELMGPLFEVSCPFLWHFFVNAQNFAKAAIGTPKKGKQAAQKAPPLLALHRYVALFLKIMLQNENIPLH